MNFLLFIYFLKWLSCFQLSAAILLVFTGFCFMNTRFFLTDFYLDLGFHRSPTMSEAILRRLDT